MGACQSSQDNEEEEKKKRSRAIDARLEEDSRRLRKECKILLLGKLRSSAVMFVELLLNLFRLRGERQIHHCQANEDHSPEWLHTR